MTGPQIVQRTDSFCGCLPRDFDRLLEAVERPPAIGRAIAIRIGRIDFEQDDVAPVALRVGETPRDVRVAADHHGGNTGKRDADQAMGPMCWGRPATRVTRDTTCLALAR